MSKEVGSIGSMGAKIEDVAPQLEKASSVLDAGVKAAEDGSWNTGIAKGKQASDIYSSAEKRLRALNNSFPNMGFSEIVADISARRQAAKQLVAACEAGKEGNQSRYSGAIDEFNELAAKTGKAEVPAFVDDPNLLLEEFWASYKTVNEKLIVAEAEHTKALDAIEAGNY
jgi:hypothetical protein